MRDKEKISVASDRGRTDLQLAFDVGHSSIGWAVLQILSSQQVSINLIGCGAVTFRADDCLASSRRVYRRQRRHIRSTRQRIARIRALLKHLGVLTEDETNRPGCAWPCPLPAGGFVMCSAGTRTSGGTAGIGDGARLK